MIDETNDEEAGLAPISHLCTKLQSWLQEKCPPIAHGFDNNGAEDDEIEMIEDRLEISLPTAYKQFIRTFNGSDEVHVLPYYHAFLSLKESLESYNEMNDANEPVIEIEDLPANSADTVVDNRFWFHPKWFPFAIENISYHSIYCIDMAPGPAGRVGQVVRWLSDGCGADVVAPSFHAWLQQQVEHCESGRYVFDEKDSCIRDVEQEKEEKNQTVTAWCIVT